MGKHGRGFQMGELRLNSWKFQSVDLMDGRNLDNFKQILVVPPRIVKSQVTV